MKTILRVLHILGLVLFLGSIVTFVVASELTQTAGLHELIFARELISRGTNLLTLPGMWLALLTGAALAARSGRLGEPRIRTKMALGLVVALNAQFVIAPAVAEATALASQSLAQGVLPDGYHSAYLRESIFGAVNVILTVTLVILGAATSRSTGKGSTAPHRTDS